MRGKAVLRHISKRLIKQSSQVMSPEQWCAYLNVSKESFNGWFEAGKIPRSYKERMEYRYRKYCKDLEKGLISPTREVLGGLLTVDVEEAEKAKKAMCEKVYKKAKEAPVERPTELRGPIPASDIELQYLVRQIQAKGFEVTLRVR